MDICSLPLLLIITIITIITQKNRLAHINFEQKRHNVFHINKVLWNINLLIANKLKKKAFKSTIN